MHTQENRKIEKNIDTVPRSSVYFPRSRTAITAFDGSFSITGVPSVQGNIQVSATFITGSGTTLAGLSISAPPVQRGVTNVGTITVVPFPVVTSVSPKSALSGSQLTVQRTGRL